MKGYPLAFTISLTMWAASLAGVSYLLSHGNQGWAFLCAMKKDFPCDNALHAFVDEPHPTMFVLAGTFGAQPDCIYKFLDLPQSKTIGIYLAGICHRKGNCKRGELLRRLSTAEINQRLAKKHPKTLREIRERVIAISKLLEGRVREIDEAILVMWLEDDLTNKAARVLYQTIRPLWPYKIARNPNGANRGSRCKECDYIEHHGASVRCNKKTIVSLDGVDIEYPHRRAALPNFKTVKEVKRWERKHNRCKYILKWTGYHQGLTEDSRTAPPPRSRQCRVPRKDIDAFKERGE